MNTEILYIVALGHTKHAAVTEARIDYPLNALAQRESVRVHYEVGRLVIPPDFKPGVLMLHRQFVNDPNMQQALEQLIAKGWVVISDMDDDPRHWAGFVDSDFYAYRAVHAVTVSTEPMAKLMVQWNPNVQVLPNALPYLPELPSSTTPKIDGKFRVFFGALNRLPEWQTIEADMNLLVLRNPQLEWVIVHERAVYDSLPETCQKVFYPTLTHDDYLTLLASCDIALLPLNDTPFNRLKSDLKLIEACACACVPIAARFLYAEDPRHANIALFAEQQSDYAHHLVSLLNNPELLEAMKTAGRDYVQKYRLHTQQASIREQFYRGLLVSRSSLEQSRKKRISAMNNVKAVEKNPPISSLRLFCAAHKLPAIALPQGVDLIGCGGYVSDMQDNTGKHISEKNARWSELTAIYWLLHNLDIQTSHVGLCHYRRFWFVPEQGLTLKKHPKMPNYMATPAEFNQSVIQFASTERILSFMQQHKIDILLPEAYTPGHSVGVSYRRNHPNCLSDLTMALEVAIAKGYLTPQFGHYFINQESLYLWNMSILPTVLFRKIWLAVFDVLLSIEDRLSVHEDVYQNRTPAFVAERLSSVLIMQEIWHPNLCWRSATCPVVMIEG